MRCLSQVALLALLVFPAALLLGGARSGPGSGLLVAAQDATEDEEAVEDTVVEDEDDEAEVEEDEPTDLVFQTLQLNLLNLKPQKDLSCLPELPVEKPHEDSLISDYQNCSSQKRTPSERTGFS